MAKLRILFVGDVVGAAGRAVYQKYIKKVQEKYSIDGIVVNGENSAHGKGITPSIVHFFKHNGTNVITSGNHIWDHKDIYPYLNNNSDVLRPANFSSQCPGVGVTTFEVIGYTIGIMNIQGRTFMNQHVDCPFRTAENLLQDLKLKTNIIFLDFHAEATSEKLGVGYFLDGKISGVVGTHTHIQTADERILPNGTGYITDLGMCGSLNSMLGMKKEAIIKRFIDQMPARFEVDDQPPFVFSGAWMEVDTKTGLSTDIQRVYIVDEELKV